MNPGGTANCKIKGLDKNLSPFLCLKKFDAAVSQFGLMFFNESFLSINPFEWSRSMDGLYAMINRLTYDAKKTGRYQVPLSVKHDLMNHCISLISLNLQKMAISESETN